MCLLLERSAIANLYECMFRSKRMCKSVCKCMHKCELSKVIDCVYILLRYFLAEDMDELLKSGRGNVCLYVARNVCSVLSM